MKHHDDHAIHTKTVAAPKGSEGKLSESGEVLSVDSPAQDVSAEDDPSISETQASEISAVETPANGSSDLDDTTDQPSESTVKISKMHYLIPASDANIQLCMNLASSAANRYPVPSILGYHGTGLFDAATTHLAKLRAIEVYLNSLGPEEDDDLVVIVDGYDVIIQLPPEIMIQRYFDIINKANARIAKRFGISVSEARTRGFYDTVIWGPDKICWPFDWAEPRCWAVPASNLPPDAFGPEAGNGDMFYNDPRWLNSGTVIGPVDDVRALVAATLEEINATYSTEYYYSESDQYYISNIWGRQEYFRSLEANKGEEVQGGPEDRRLPTTRTGDQQIEYHIGIDYESALFQTKAGYEPFFGYLQFNTSGLNANMDIDIFEEGETFAPYNIEMPADVYAALERLFNSFADPQSQTTTYEWIRTIKLNVNYVTRHIFTLWHCTGPKDPIVDEYPKMWFFPYAKSLIKAAVKALRGDELLMDHLVDGRKWAPKNRYPDTETMSDELGGAWTDLDGGQFIEWHDLCGQDAPQLFGNEEPPQSQIFKAVKPL